MIHKYRQNYGGEDRGKLENESPEHDLRGHAFILIFVSETEDSNFLVYLEHIVIKALHQNPHLSGNS